MVSTTAIHVSGSRLPFFQPFSRSTLCRLSNHFIRYFQTQSKDVNTVWWNFLFHSCRLYLKTYGGLDSSRKSTGWFRTAKKAPTQRWEAEEYCDLGIAGSEENDSDSIPEMAVPPSKVKQIHCQWGSQFLFFRIFTLTFLCRFSWRLSPPFLTYSAHVLVSKIAHCT